MLTIITTAYLPTKRTLCLREPLSMTDEICKWSRFPGPCALTAIHSTILPANWEDKLQVKLQSAAEKTFIPSRSYWSGEWISPQNRLPRLALLPLRLKRWWNRPKSRRRILRAWSACVSERVSACGGTEFQSECSVRWRHQPLVSISICFENNASWVMSTSVY